MHSISHVSQAKLDHDSASRLWGSGAKCDDVSLAWMQVGKGAAVTENLL